MILISSVLITDRQGTLWVNNPLFPEVIGKNFAYRDWYKNVSKDSKPYLKCITTGRWGKGYRRNHRRPYFR